MTEQLLRAIQENRLYDYIANNSWQMDKKDIVIILGEVLYLLHTKNINTNELDIVELLERLGEDEDDEE